MQCTNINFLKCQLSFHRIHQGAVHLQPKLKIVIFCLIFDLFFLIIVRKYFSEHIGDVIKELNNLKKNFEISEKEKNEAVTKLNVLTDYFKDKETKLHK